MSFKPMLAFKYEKHLKKVRFPCLVQPKLNGVRMLYSNDVMQSRSNGKEEAIMWRTDRLKVIREELKSLSARIILDGELYIHGWSLQKINSAAGVNKLKDDLNSDKLEYHVFDFIDKDAIASPMSERAVNLVTLLEPIEGVHIKRVSTYVCNSSDELEQRLREFKLAGYEGLMYRDICAPYGLATNCGNKQNRWTTLLKRKDWSDIDLPIQAVNPGKDKYEGQVGSFVFKFTNGRFFNAGTGLSDFQRRKYVDESPIGLMCKIKYEMLSDEGVPLKPTIECFYE